MLFLNMKITSVFSGTLWPRFRLGLHGGVGYLLGLRFKAGREHGN